MAKKPEVLAIIPARGGSKRIPGKNIKRLCGIPLIGHTINAVKKSKMIDRIVVSTDSIEISEIAKLQNIEVIDRPSNIAADESLTVDAVKHVLEVLEIKEKYSPELLIILQPTSPLRTTKDIEEALKIAIKDNKDSVVSVCDGNPFWHLKEDKKALKPLFDWKYFKLRKQDIQKTYVLNGAIYVVKSEHIRTNSTLFSEDMGFYGMLSENSIDIDTEFDFKIAEIIVHSKKIATRKKIKIKDKFIGDNEPCFIIAEAGVNHNGELELAKKLIDVAVDAKADAVKFQTYNPNNLVTKNLELAAYQKNNIGKDISQYEMLEKLALDYKFFETLKLYCDKKEIIFLSTPHTTDAIEVVDKISELHKIGSGDLTNHPFLCKIAKTGKPIILSTGMSTIEEIAEALQVIGEYTDNIGLLHCTTNYPCEREEVNLRAMQTLEKTFGCYVGYSDHTSGMTAPLLAVAMGAKIIEKHFTLDKEMDGPDHKCSLNPDELSKMVQSIRNAELFCGSFNKEPTENEKKIAKTIRKSIVAFEEIPENTVIKEEMLIIKRPGTGLLPKYMNKIVGMKTKRKINEGEPIFFEHLVK